MAHKIRLTLDQQYELADLMQTHKGKKLSRRLLAISLRHFGYTIKEISLLTHVSERTVTNWMKLFAEGGFESLLTLQYKGTPHSKLDPFKAHIQTFLESYPNASIKDLHRFLQKEYQLKVDYSWLYRYVHAHFSQT